MLLVAGQFKLQANGNTYLKKRQELEQVLMKTFAGGLLLIAIVITMKLA